MLGQGKGGAGDRFVDAQAGGQPLHQAGFAGPQVAVQQQGAGGGQPGCQLPTEGQGGGGVGEVKAHSN